METVIVFVLVVFSGIFSGLNLGLLSLDVYELQRKVKLGNKYAEKILPIRKNGNLLLTTLLLGNVIVNSVLSVFLANLTTGVIGVIVSTCLIVAFGEIIPQAAFSRYALKIGAFFAPLTRLIMIVLYPIAAPIAYLLNRVLGDELPEVWSKEELKDIVSSLEKSPDSNVDLMDRKIITGVLSFSESKAKDIMTPRRLVFSLREDEVVNDKLFDRLEKYNFSRIPVYNVKRTEIVGILYLKDIMNLDEDIKLKEVIRKKSHINIDESEPLDNLLADFINKRVRIAMVYNSRKLFTGIVTLEDVIEEILQDELYDEIDQTSKARMIKYGEIE
jgi:metal transporter CNNM